MNNKLLFGLVLFLTFCSQPAFSNPYDDEEKLRRYVENAEKQEQKERDAARKRADIAEYEQNHSKGGDGGISLLVIGLLVFGIAKARLS